jgi:two-component system, cell cycle response regulator
MTQGSDPPIPKAEVRPPAPLKRRSTRALAAARIGRIILDIHDQPLRNQLDEMLTGAGHSISDAPSDNGLVETLVLYNAEHGALLRGAAAAARGLPFVIVGDANTEAVCDAFHAGAADYVALPIDADRMSVAVVRGLERHRLNREQQRTQQDLALFMAAQRMLETLDHERLLSMGLEAMGIHTRSQAVAFVAEVPTATDSPDDKAARAVLGAQHLTDEDMMALESAELPVSFAQRFTGAALGLPRFAAALSLDLGDGRHVLLFSDQVVSSLHEEAALFLGRQWATAWKNADRYVNATDQARRDPLTGLWNATTFATSLQHELDTSPDRPCSLLFFDLDKFKSVNDVHGHLAGSRLLSELAAVLHASFREGDLLSRYGGDEFTALLPAIGLQDAISIAERMRALVERRRFAVTVDRPEGIQITVSIGVAAYPEHGRILGTLLARADDAMYLSKGKNRNCVTVAGLPDTTDASSLPSADETRQTTQR